MKAMTQRDRRIEHALRRCAADLGGEPLGAEAYEAWRLDLDKPYSVPTALAIAGTKREFTTVCIQLGIGSTVRSRRQTVDPPEAVAVPATSDRSWDQQTVTQALRRCADDPASGAQEGPNATKQSRNQNPNRSRKPQGL